MSNVAISVVIPTYGRTLELARAVSSVRSQSTDIELEVLVINDNEGNSEISECIRQLEELKSDSVHLIENSRSSGGGGARNAGIIASQAGWIAFLDDDDEWLPEKISHQYAVAQTLPPDIALIDSGFIETNHSAGLRKIIVPNLKDNAFSSMLGKAGVRAPKLSTVLVRRSALIEIGMFDESLPSRQDLDLFLRLSQRYAFHSIERPLAIKHIGEGSRISTDRKKKILGFQLFYTKYKAAFEDNPDAHRAFLNNYARWLRKAGHFIDYLRVKVRALIL